MPSIVTKIRVEGMREARANAVALQRLTTGSMREALTKAHRPMVRAARANAPVRTGLLKKSITSKIVTKVRESMVFAIIGPDKRVHGGTASGEFIRPSRYAHLVELGTPKSAAHPFLRPAYEAEMANAIKIYGNSLGPAIEKTAARLARTSYQPGEAALMAPMLTDLLAWLRAFPALGALLGAGSAMRLYASMAPQGAQQPTMIYTIVAAPHIYTMDVDALPLLEAVIQFDIDSQSVTTCRQVGDALFTALSARRFTQGATEFEGIFHDGREDTTVEQSLVEGTTQSHRLSIDYRIQFRNP